MDSLAERADFSTADQVKADALRIPNVTIQMQTAIVGTLDKTLAPTHPEIDTHQNPLSALLNPLTNNTQYTLYFQRLRASGIPHGPCIISDWIWHNTPSAS